MFCTASPYLLYSTHIYLDSLSHSYSLKTTSRTDPFSLKTTPSLSKRPLDSLLLLCPRDDVSLVTASLSNDCVSLSIVVDTLSLSPESSFAHFPETLEALLELCGFISSYFLCMYSSRLCLLIFFIDLQNEDDSSANGLRPDTALTALFCYFLLICAFGKR